MKNFTLFIFLTFVYSMGFSQEICDNGIDDDADGLIDLQDTTDCKCSLTFSSTSTSIIPNPSFELRSGCPIVGSQLSNVNNWIKASGPSSDYYNTCGLRKMPFPAYIFPPTPLPDGQGYVGFLNGGSTYVNRYKEYVGTCLLDTLHSGTSYTIDLHMFPSKGDTITTVGIFGTPNCSDIPFGGWSNNFGCPTNAPNFVSLDSLSVTLSTTSWTKVTFTFTPTVNVTAIVIGPSCRNVAGMNYYFIDNLVLNPSIKKTTFAEIKDTGHYCQNNLILKAKYDTIPKHFQWYKNGIALIGDTNSTFSVPNGGIGDYQVRLLYDSGCISTSVYKVDSTIIDFDYDTTGSCLANNSGKIIVHNARGGTPSYLYKSNISAFTSDTVLRNLSPGSYTVTVQDTNLCEGVKTINIKKFSKSTANFITDSVCLGLPTTFTDKSTINAGNITKWKWLLSGTPTTQNTTYTFSTDGTFPIKLEVKSDSGCIADTTLDVIVHPLPIPNFSFSPQEIYVFDTKVCFANSSSGAVNYLWNFDFVGINGKSNASNPCYVTFPNDKSFTYKVKLIAISQFGCIDSTLVDVIILNGFILYIPNSFTPNEDGVNDVLKINTEGISKIDFTIFNRWGETIYETTDVTKSWDGKHKSVLVPFGTYVYRVALTSLTGETKEIIGHVNVLR